MRKVIRFGGRRGSARSRDDIDASLSAVLEQLSWKYVKAQAEFSPTNSIEEIQPDDLRGSIAHWAGRVWCHANEVPSGIALRKFDLMELKEPFRPYLDKHGGKIFDDGLEVEEIWASQQLHDASPVAAFVVDRHKSLPSTGAIEMFRCRGRPTSATPGSKRNWRPLSATGRRRP